MYMRFFGLKQEPFSLAPDPRYLYMSKRHREALAHLLYGSAAAAASSCSRRDRRRQDHRLPLLLEQIPKRCNVAYIFNPKLTVLELVKSVCDEFRSRSARARPGPTVKTYVDALNDFLLKTHAVGQNNVLIIDEAQMLSVDVLEQLRLLTNLETNERKLLQIVLIGQPELRTMLERPDLEQLAQRVIARFHLKALSSKETEHYIRHRLSVAGMTRAIRSTARRCSASTRSRAACRGASTCSATGRCSAPTPTARPASTAQPSRRRRARCSASRSRTAPTARAWAPARAGPRSSPPAWR
jgi:general secretion pathway protein A